METGLERIARKAKESPKQVFTSLAHHITPVLLRESLNTMKKETATGVDRVSIEEARETFDTWSRECIKKVHTGGYKPPPVRRVYIPKPGKKVKRPIGVPTVFDRALQRSASKVLEQIFEQDFLDCSFGGRPGRGQHHALCTLNEIVSGKKIGWIFETDIQNFFGSIDHGWCMELVKHRVKDPRILKLLKRWLKCGVVEAGAYQDTPIGTPQGGSISVLLSNVYLHYVLDLWFEKVVKKHLRGEAYLVRYIDDFVVCFQYRSDALRFQTVLAKRLSKFRLAMEPSKTKLIEFGTYSRVHNKRRGRKQATFTFLGITHHCDSNRNGRFKIGRKTEKNRLKRAILSVRIRTREVMHLPIPKQADQLNTMLRGHYNYYGLGGNHKSLWRLYRMTEKLWFQQFRKRSRKGGITWEKYHRLKANFPLLRPYLKIPYNRMSSFAIL